MHLCAITQQRVDPQCDGTEELSLRKFDVMPCKVWEVLAVHHKPSSEANRGVCRKIVMLDVSLGTRQFPVNQTMWKNLHEFLHVGGSARQQEWTFIPTCSSEHGCLHRSRKISPQCSMNQLLNQLSITEPLRNGAVVETCQRHLSRMRTEVATHQS